jgi:hypothetical protein
MGQPLSPGLSRRCHRIGPHRPGTVAKLNAVRAGMSATARSRRCIDGSASRMLSLRHSLGKSPPFVPLTGDAKSLPRYRCYSSTLLTQTFSNKGYKLIFCIPVRPVYGAPGLVHIPHVLVRELLGCSPAVTWAEKNGASQDDQLQGHQFLPDIILTYARWNVAGPHKKTGCSGEGGL